MVVFILVVLKIWLRKLEKVDDIIRDAGEQATFEINVHNMHPDLVKILGRLNYRTSYGQNVLNILLKWRTFQVC